MHILTIITLIEKPLKTLRHPRSSHPDQIKENTTSRQTFQRLLEDVYLNWGSLSHSFDGGCRQIDVVIVKSGMIPEGFHCK